MGSFLYIIGHMLFLQCGLTFGSDFRPTSWEIVRHIIEELEQSLFKDTSLRTKHRKYLDKLKWHADFGSKKANFTPAPADTLNQGIPSSEENLDDTPHHIFVNDDIYTTLYNIMIIEQTIAASIEAMFILLEDSDFSQHQDHISWDKLQEMPIS